MIKKQYSKQCFRLCKNAHIENEEVEKDEDDHDEKIKRNGSRTCGGCTGVMSTRAQPIFTYTIEMYVHAQ